VLSQPWYDLLFFEILLARTFAKFGVNCRLLNLPEHHAAGPNAQLLLIIATTQWRTQKIFMGVHSVAYGRHLYLMCTVCDVAVWRHIHVCKPTFHNLQLEYQAAPMSPIRAVKHRKCAAGLAGAHPGLRDRILLNYTRIENAQSKQENFRLFLLCIEVQQTFSFPFSLLKH